MRADPRSLLYQLVGEKITVLSTGLTGRVGKVEPDSKCKFVTFHLHYKVPTKEHPEGILQFKKINLSLIALLKDIKVHKLD